MTTRSAATPDSRLRRRARTPLRQRLRPALVVGGRLGASARLAARRRAAGVAACSGSCVLAALGVALALSCVARVRAGRQGHAGALRSTARVRRGRALPLGAQPDVPGRRRGDLRRGPLPALASARSRSRRSSSCSRTRSSALRRAEPRGTLRRQLPALQEVGGALAAAASGRCGDDGPAARGLREHRRHRRASQHGWRVQAPAAQRPSARSAPTPVPEVRPGFLAGYLPTGELPTASRCCRRRRPTTPRPRPPTSRPIAPPARCAAPRAGSSPPRTRT